MAEKLARELMLLRQNHPAWRLLLANRAPLILHCLQPLFDYQHQSVLLEDAERKLADTLTEYANDVDVAADDGNSLLAARRELRNWIRRGLLVEREGALQATDALQRALHFVEGLRDGSSMTSTASRLGSVQREIDNLAVQLNADPQQRSQRIERDIALLRKELERAKRGEIDTLNSQQAREGIRNIYDLATSLLADFRRVEDSYREADKQLRQTIIQAEQNRGVIVDNLLSSHAHLVQTPEGQVFQSFNQQVQQTDTLSRMRAQIKEILKHPQAQEVLSWQQQYELKMLKMLLTKEAQAVVKARARSEDDVKNFIQTGLAAEHHRVGQLLNATLEVALNIDWDSAKIRRGASGLQPIGASLALGNVPLIERLRFKEMHTQEAQALQLEPQTSTLNDIDDDFWQAFDTLDREVLERTTRQWLRQWNKPATIGDLCRHLLGAATPKSEAPEAATEGGNVSEADKVHLRTHDLETIAMWLHIAREAGCAFSAEQEEVEIQYRVDDTHAVAHAHSAHKVQAVDTMSTTRFTIPKVAMHYADVADLEWFL